MRGKWEWVATYDPAQDIQQIRIHVLVVLGGNDRPSLSAIAQERWRTALVKAGNHDATVLEFLDAGHGLTIGNSHQLFLSGGTPKYATGYMEIIDAWLKAHGGSN